MHVNCQWTGLTSDKDELTEDEMWNRVIEWRINVYVLMSLVMVITNIICMPQCRIIYQSLGNRVI